MAGRVYISVVENSERGIFTVSDLYPSLGIGSNRQLVNGRRENLLHLGSCSIFYLQQEMKYNGCKLGG